MDFHTLPKGLRLVRKHAGSQYIWVYIGDTLFGRVYRERNGNGVVRWHGYSKANGIKENMYTLRGAVLIACMPKLEG